MTITTTEIAFEQFLKKPDHPDDDPELRELLSIGDGGFLLHRLRAPGKSSADLGRRISDNEVAWRRTSEAAWIDGVKQGVVQNAAVFQGVRTVVSDAIEAERLVRALRLLVACEGVALARQSDGFSDLAQAEARCDALVDGDTGWSRVAGDVCAYLLTGNPETASAIRKVRVVSYKGDKGFPGVLTLEWFPDSSLRKVKFAPHPESLLLVRNDTFRKAFLHALAWARKKFAPTSGLVRWNLRMDSALYYAQGGSIGGAIGAGLAFLWGEDYSDMSIGVTATIGRSGKLGRIGGAPQKITAGLDGTFHALVTPEVTEGDVRHAETTHAIHVKPVATMDDVLAYFEQKNRPRRDLLNALQDKYEFMPLLEDEAVKLPMRGEDGLYCPIPLLQEIKVESLPKGPPGSASGQDDDAIQKYRDDMSAWREAGRESVQKGPPRSIEWLFSNTTGELLRFVILGDPGSGKTTLTRLIALDATQPETFVRWKGKKLLPVVVPLRAWQTHGVGSLKDFLPTIYPMVPQDIWPVWLERGELLLLLDGLDEVTLINGAGIATELAGLVKAKKCSMIVTCRILSRSQLVAIGIESEVKDSGVDRAKFPLYEMGSLKDDQKAEYVRKYFSLPGEDPDRIAPLIERLRSDGEYRMLAGNPMILSLICYLTQSVSVKSLPRTRAALYELAVSDLLGKAEAGPKNTTYRENASINEERLRVILEQLALEMMGGRLLRDSESVSITERQLFLSNVGLDETIVRPRETLERWSGARVGSDKAVRMHLQANSRLFVGDPEPGGAGQFFHLSIQEYLAACGLARRVENGWDEATWSPDTRQNRKGFVAIRDYVDRMSWLPEWEPTLRFLAARLKLLADNAEKAGYPAKRDFFLTALCDYLELLSDETRDDLFHERLALALFCLEDIRPLETERAPA